MNQHCSVKLLLHYSHRDQKCDMIKGNESDVRNTDFALQAQRNDKFLCFTLFLNFKELFISLQPDVQLRWDLDQNVAFQMKK